MGKLGVADVIIDQVYLYIVDIQYNRKASFSFPSLLDSIHIDSIVF
jgi:hypothetical protein